MKDFLRFKIFITPIIIQVLFWIFVIFTVIGGLVLLFNNVIAGLATIIFGPVFIRVWFELVILFFKIYERLGSIDDKTPGKEE